MRIACVGGGPAGLYTAITAKLRDPGHEITVYERNKAGAAHGWGVILGQDLLAELHDVDAVSATAIERAGHHWRDQVVRIRGQQDLYTGSDACNISRQRLVDVLAARAVELGARIEYGHDVRDPAQLAGADLIVAADGAGSALRETAGSFGTTVKAGGNKYIWLATSRLFDSFHFLFTETDAGWIWAHAYQFDAQMSTFIVECAPWTWSGLGFDTMAADDALATLGRLFADHLLGHPLTGRFPDETDARWLSFRTVSNERWHDGTMVLAGDSARTAHFSIGQGTKLALEDAIVLADCLGQAEPANLEAALQTYEARRRAETERRVSEARCSAQWFENVPRYTGLRANQFATLLRARRSPLLTVLPPRVSYQVHQATERITVLHGIRGKIGPAAKIMYGRRSA
jgi:2-polyprenyl-6-methoxyphenol hydroxylase-like FAD-dependent oxidoreductase